MSRKKVFRNSRTDIVPFSARERLKLLFNIKHGYPLDYPRQFWIEITNECNLRCIMCPVSIGLRREKAVMGINSFEKIIDQICMVKPRIMLHVAGEPLLNKDLLKMIQYAKNKDCWVGVHTNATLLTEEMSVRILKSSLDYISFSVDGHTKEIYEKVRVGAKFDQVKSQIETFLKLRSKKNVKIPITKVEILIMPETKAQTVDFTKHWQATGIDRISIKLAGNWMKFVYPRNTKEISNFGYRPCSDIFFKCAILADGRVVPCCNDIGGRLSLGNILKQSFGDIWNGDLYNLLRRQHLKNVISRDIICYDCGFRFFWSRSEQIKYSVLKHLLWRNISQ